ncbi:MULTISPECIES: septal ring lytic transglycosylase RlpA family protein [unclassified Lonepinella]|uniref:septal ring lytic transglycosylase RlpA family protein n=1 Tax=unclassified Lonepinella TaxID=2642006 RepID=UPI0036D9CFDE
MHKFKLLLAICLAFFLTACTSSAQATKSTPRVNLVKTEKISDKNIYMVNGKKYTNISTGSAHYEKTGKASYYHQKFHGNRTASGEIYNSTKLTAAHRTLPIGTHVLVTNLKNNRQVVVRINDRGPFTKSRVIDLSRSAASQLGMISSGVVNVKVEKLHLVRN